MNIFKIYVKVSNLSTVSDTKRKFYSQHDRPINSIFRRVVEELLVEMHLLSVNDGFKYDPIYALGVVSSYDKFMAAYQPAADQDSIFRALCASIGADADSYRRDSSDLSAAATGLAGQNLEALLAYVDSGAANSLTQTWRTIAQSNGFKYSRLFGLGLFTLLEQVAPSQLEEATTREATVAKLAEVLHLPADKLSKDLDAYRANLAKLAQMQAAMADVLEADRKKREQREQEKAANEPSS